MSDIVLSLVFTFALSIAALRSSRAPLWLSISAGAWRSGLRLARFHALNQRKKRKTAFQKRTGALRRPFQYCLFFVSIGISALPIPGVAAHFVKISLRMPTKLLFRPLCRSITSGNITFPPRRKLIGNLFARRARKRFDDFQNAAPLSCPKIIRIYATF